MSTSNGQNASAEVFNAAYVSKTTDSTTVGSLTVNKPADGAAVNVQVDVNQLKADVLALNSDVTSLEAAIAALDSGAPSVSGSVAVPTAVVAAEGIAFSGSTWLNTHYISGSGGSVTVTASPRITAATNLGQRLRLIIPAGANQITLADGNGLDLNGSFVGAAGSMLDLEWDGVNWFEIGRRSV